MTQYIVQENTTKLTVGCAMTYVKYALEGAGRLEEAAEVAKIRRDVISGKPIELERAAFWLLQFANDPALESNWEALGMDALVEHFVLEKGDDHVPYWQVISQAAMAIASWWK